MSESWRYHLQSHCAYARISLLEQEARRFVRRISHIVCLELSLQQSVSYGLFIVAFFGFLIK